MKKPNKEDIKYRIRIGNDLRISYKTNWELFAKDLEEWTDKQFLLHNVSQRSELFAEQDSKDFILWQRDRDIRRLENGKYKWREFEYNRKFFLEKYLEDRIRQIETNGRV